MIWTACAGADHIAPIAGTLFRLVESQEQIATLGFVDSLEEQALLEAMLEAAKPEYPMDTGELHYLLKTPFRYPPLPWGSRFGRRHEPGIFYGGKSPASTLAESAYYRLVFWYSMNGAPVKESIRSEHTMFAANYRSDVGIQLQEPPFASFHSNITHPKDYSQTQLLGTAMREAGVEVFEYSSARDPADGLCVGLFTPAAFSVQKPIEASQWLCEVSAGEVAFKHLAQSEVKRFALREFLLDGVLPTPAH